MAIDIEEGLLALILSKPAVTAIAAQRVFPNQAPARELLPSVIFRRTGGGPIHTLGGVSGAKPATFQVESWSETSQDQARQLDLAVQQIAGFRGAIGLAWWFQAVLVDRDTDQDNPQIPIHAEDLGLFCSFTQYRLWYVPQ